jgi:hypothetical protein
MRGLMDRRFFNDNYMARIRRIAIVAFARHPCSASAPQFIVECHAGMVLAHPSEA